MAKKNKEAKQSKAGGKGAAEPKKDKKPKKAGKADKQSKKLAPKPIGTGKGATPMEIGAAVVEHLRAQRPDAELWKKFWSKKAVSIEGGPQGMIWDGIKAIAAKSEQWMATHKIHSFSVEGPFVGATGFSLRFQMDVEDTTNGQRMNMAEVGVYHVKGGKVIREEFMYGMM